MSPRRTRAAWLALALPLGASVACAQGVWGAPTPIEAEESAGAEAAPIPVWEPVRAVALADALDALQAALDRLERLVQPVARTWDLRSLAGLRRSRGQDERELDVDEGEESRELELLLEERSALSELDQGLVELCQGRGFLSARGSGLSMARLERDLSRLMAEAGRPALIELRRYRLDGAPELSELGRAGLFGDEDLVALEQAAVRERPLELVLLHTRVGETVTLDLLEESGPGGPAGAALDLVTGPLPDGGVELGFNLRLTARREGATARRALQSDLSSSVALPAAGGLALVLPGPDGGDQLLLLRVRPAAGGE